MVGSCDCGLKSGGWWWYSADVRCTALTEFCHHITNVVYDTVACISTSMHTSMMHEHWYEALDKGKIRGQHKAISIEGTWYNIEAVDIHDNLATDMCVILPANWASRPDPLLPSFLTLQIDVWPWTWGLSRCFWDLLFLALQIAVWLGTWDPYKMQ